MYKSYKGNVMKKLNKKYNKYREIERCSPIPLQWVSHKPFNKKSMVPKPLVPYIIL